MPKDTNLRKNNVLVIPPVLEGLARIKQRLQGTDRDDHIADVLAEEEKAKEALLKLAARENEGIKILLVKAKEELEAVYRKIHIPPATDETRDDYYTRQALNFQQRDLWLWFLDFFDEAERAKAEVEHFVAEQQQPQVADDY